VTWRIDWSRHAEKDVLGLDRQAANRILNAIERLAEHQQGDVRRLQGVDPPEWRLRVGRLASSIRL
jgi:mRNA-degrading endonuclease RelE of RelBE toxin-antitoxin system